MGIPAILVLYDYLTKGIRRYTIAVIIGKPLILAVFVRHLTTNQKVWGSNPYERTMKTTLL